MVASPSQATVFLASCAQKSRERNDKKANRFFPLVSTPQARQRFMAELASPEYQHKGDPGLFTIVLAIVHVAARLAHARSNYAFR